MPENRTTTPPVLLVVLAVLLWSTGGMFIKLAVNLDAYQVTFFRSLLAGLTVLILTWRAGLRINVFGLMCSGIYAVLLFLFVWATKHTTAANAIFLQYTAPVYILVLAPFVIGEKFYKKDLATVIFCLVGMSLFFVGDLTIGDYQGNIAALGSGVFLGLYIMLLKHPRATGESSPLPTSAADGGDAVVESEGEIHNPDAGRRALNPAITVIYGNFLLALLTLPSGVATLPAATFRDYAAVTFLGIFQIGISYILFIKGVHGGTRPLDASIIGFIEPLLNPVWVFFFVGERPSQWALLGGAIIIATIVVHTIVQYRTRPTPQPAAWGAVKQTDA